MYIVRDRKTKEVIHVNPAPLIQNLSMEEIYYLFNHETMELVKTDQSEIPEEFQVDADGNIIELSIRDKVARHIISIEPTQKIAVESGEERIVAKTLSELIDEQLMELSPFQKITGEGENEEIIEKSLDEQLNEGLIELGDYERIVNNEIVTYTPQELFELDFINLDEYKKLMIDRFSVLSFEHRDRILPEYRLLNVSLDVYSEREKSEIKETVNAFRNEFYRLKEAIEGASTGEEVALVKENFPSALVKPNDQDNITQV